MLCGWPEKFDRLKVEATHTGVLNFGVELYVAQNRFKLYGRNRIKIVCGTVCLHNNICDRVRFYLFVARSVGNQIFKLFEPTYIYKLVLLYYIVSVPRA